MPLFDFKCEDCAFKKEHFVADKSVTKKCPKCGSTNYNKSLGSFKLNVEYSNVQEIVENKINPSVAETFQKIGSEALDQDTKTLDNIYGKEKVENTFYTKDD